MLNRATSRRRRSISRTSYTIGLLVLFGAVTALVVVVRVPAHSTTQPAPPRPSSSVADVHPAAGAPVLPDGEGQPPAGSSGPPATSAPSDGARVVQARDAGPDSDTAADLHRSLVLSGLLGLTISLTGLVMVGSRRRMW